MTPCPRPDCAPIVLPAYTKTSSTSVAVSYDYYPHPA